MRKSRRFTTMSTTSNTQVTLRDANFAPAVTCLSTAPSDRRPVDRHRLVYHCTWMSHISQTRQLPHLHRCHRCTFQGHRNMLRDHDTATQTRFTTLPPTQVSPSHHLTTTLHQHSTKPTYGPRIHNPPAHTHLKPRTISLISPTSTLFHPHNRPLPPPL